MKATIRWTIDPRSGYNVCNLRVDRKLVARCNGGGYDMVGTCFGIFIARKFPERLNKLDKKFYGLKFHDPNYDPSKAVVEGTGRTVGELEASGESLGLERYQAVYRGSSDLPTKNHTVPEIDGGCGMSAVQRIFEAIGGAIKQVKTRGDDATYEITA